jgi:hypothetical protein
MELAMAQDTALQFTRRLNAFQNEVAITVSWNLKVLTPTLFILTE